MRKIVSDNSSSHAFCNTGYHSNNNDSIPYTSDVFCRYGKARVDRLLCGVHRIKYTLNLIKAVYWVNIFLDLYLSHFTQKGP